MITTTKMDVSKNFTLEELISSPTAKRLGIDNSPNSSQLNNLKKLCEKVLQPLRDKYGKPIIITSGLRVAKLNKAVGGAPTSDHMYGRAADIRAISDLPEDNKLLWDLIKEMVKSGEIVVKQVINEFDYNWIHVSYLEDSSKKNLFLKAVKRNGKTIYIKV